MRCRREERLSLRLRTVVSGVDRTGKVFREEADTLDFSTLGARLSGLNTELEPGAVVALLHGDRCARFRVTWVGNGTPETHGQIGLRCIEVGTSEVRRILHIDDEDGVSRARAGLLRGAGYEVVTTPSAATGWQQLIERRFDLMLLDFPVPDADATEVVEAVRKYWPAMRVLINTSTPSAIPDVLLGGVDDWVHKNVSGAELLTRISQLIGTTQRFNWPVARTNRRYLLEVPVALRIFRGGVPTLLHGRSLDLSTSGVGMELGDEILPGELATAYFRIPDANNTQLSPRVMVRRRKGTFCGLEFVDLSMAEADAIEQACVDLPMADMPVDH